MEQSLQNSEKVKAKCLQRGYEPKQIAPEFLSQFFEGASMEDNDTHEIIIRLGNQVLILTDTTKTLQSLNLKVYNMTNAEKELFNLINSPTDNDYNKALGYDLENTLSEAISVSLSNIIKNSSDGVIEIGPENLLRK